MIRSAHPAPPGAKQIHDQGLVTVLRQIHDELDEAVLEAYGWGDLSERDTSIPACSSSPGASPEEAGRNAYITELLTRLVALNHERAAEEKRGITRWLRPDYQNPTSATSDGHPSSQSFDGTSRPPLQADLAGTASSSNQKSKINNPQSSINPSSSFQWHDRLPDQVTIIRKLINSGDRNVAAPYDAEALSGLFGRKNKKRTEQIEGILETLKGLGQL